MGASLSQLTCRSIPWSRKLGSSCTCSTSTTRRTRLKQPLAPMPHRYSTGLNGRHPGGSHAPATASHPDHYSTRRNTPSCNTSAPPKNASSRADHTTAARCCDKPSSASSAPSRSASTSKPSGTTVSPCRILELEYLLARVFVPLFTAELARNSRALLGGLVRRVEGKEVRGEGGSRGRRGTLGGESGNGRI